MSNKYKFKVFCTRFFTLVLVSMPKPVGEPFFGFSGSFADQWCELDIGALRIAVSWYWPTAAAFI